MRLVSIDEFSEGKRYNFKMDSPLNKYCKNLFEYENFKRRKV